MILKLACDTYMNKYGVPQFHYSDTSLVFELIDGNIYAFDRDDFSEDVFKQGDFKETLLSYLGSHNYEQFLLDFGGKGLTLCSSFDTHSIEINH